MPTDILDRLLTTLAVRVHAFALCEIKKGWRIAVDPMEGVTIHYILAGSGTIAVGEGKSIAFRPNCVVIVPAGVSQTLGDPDPSVAVTSASDICELRADGLLKFTAGGGSRNIFCACGTIAATYAGALGLFDFVREPIVEDVSDNPAMRRNFETLLSEIASPGLGTQAIAEALMKQCLVLLLRRQLGRPSVDSPLLAALQDNRLARVIASIVEQPTAAHTVEGLANLAGMSRSTFAERFATAYGQSPIEFVLKVRLRLGAQLLVSTTLPVKVISSSVGYASRSYFTRAFRAAYGADPTTYRTHGGFADRPPRSKTYEPSANRADP